MLTQRYTNSNIENSRNKHSKGKLSRKKSSKRKSQVSNDKKLDELINSFALDNIQSGNMFDMLVEDFNERIKKHKNGTKEEKRFAKRIIEFKEFKNNGTIVYDNNEKKFVLNDKVKRSIKSMKGGMWPFSSDSSETALAEHPTTQVSNFATQADRGMEVLLNQLQERNELNPTSMAQLIELQRQLTELKERAANEEVARQRELARIENERSMTREAAAAASAVTADRNDARRRENAKLIGITLKQIIKRVFFLVAAYGVSSLAMGTLSIGEASVGAVGGVVGSATGFLASATDYVTYGATLGFSGTSVSDWWEQGTQVGSEVREGYHDARTGLQISITLAVYGLIELTNAIVTFIRNMDEVSIGGLFRVGRSSSRESQQTERVQTPSRIEQPLDTPQRSIARISGQQSSAATALSPTLTYFQQPQIQYPSSTFSRRRTTRRALTPPPSDSVQELNSSSLLPIDYDLNNNNNNNQSGGMLKMRKKRKLRSRRKRNVKSHKSRKSKLHKRRKSKSHKKRSKQTRKK